MMNNLEEKKNDRSSFEIEVEFKFDDADGNDVVKDDDIEVPTEIYIKAIKEYCASKLVKVDGSDTDIFNLFSYYLKSKDTLEDDKDFEAICRELYLKSNYYEEDLDKVAEDYGYNLEESLNEDKESMLDKIADDISNILMAKEIDAWIKITNNESVDVGTNNKETFYLIVKELKSNGYNFMRDISGTSYYGVRITEKKESNMITFNELLKRTKTEKIAIHTPTEKQAKTLLKALDKSGYVWKGGNKLTATTYYNAYKENTCYTFGFDKKVMFGLLKFYEDEGYAIIEFSDINFKEKESGLDETLEDINEDVSSPSRVIKTGLHNDVALEVLKSIMGQLSDGYWENSPRMEAVWKNVGMEKIDGEICICLYNRYGWGYNLSDDEVKKYFASKIKFFVQNAETTRGSSDWKRDSKVVVDGMGYDKEITIADCYAVYDKLNNRINRSKEFSTVEKLDLDEASSAQKKSFKQGGDATKDLIFGKSVARVKNPRARQAAINARKAGREDIADMFIGDRKKSQADAANVKKSTQMAKAGLSEGLGQDFYGTKEGTEEADDLLFGLQVEFGQPKYNYDDFRSIDVDEHTLELAKKHASELDKFNYFNPIKSKKSFLDPEEGLDESSTDEIAKRLGGILLPKDERKPTYKFEILWYEGSDEYEAGQSDPKTKTFDYKLDAFRFYNKHKEDTDKFDFWFTKRDAETWEVVEEIRG